MTVKRIVKRKDYSLREGVGKGRGGRADKAADDMVGKGYKRVTLIAGRTKL